MFASSRLRTARVLTAAGISTGILMGAAVPSHAAIGWTHQAYQRWC